MMRTLALTLALGLTLSGLASSADAKGRGKQGKSDRVVIALENIDWQTWELAFEARWAAKKAERLMGADLSALKQMEHANEMNRKLTALVEKLQRQRNGIPEPKQ